MFIIASWPSVSLSSRQIVQWGHTHCDGHTHVIARVVQQGTSCKRFTARKLYLMLSTAVHAHLPLLTDLLEHEQVAVASHLGQ
jgi:hypothetical protein